MDILEKLYKNNNNNKNGKLMELYKQFYLIKCELMILRIDWLWTLLIVLITPLTLLLLLYYITGDSSQSSRYYLLTGNMVMSLTTGTMLTLGQELGILKQVRGFDYYITLKVRKIQLIFAYIVRTTILTLPSMFVIFIVGKYFLDIPINIHLSLILVVLFSGLSLSAIGGFIGLYARDASQASIITQVIQPIFVFCAPVFIPVSKMPNFMFYISRFIPTTYVASALRDSCKGIYDIRSILILFMLSLISIILIETKMDWRS